MKTGIKTGIVSEKTKKILKILDRYKYVLIVVLAGLILLMLPSGGNDGNEVQTENRMEEDLYDVDELEQKLGEVLGEIEGVGRVRVLLTLKSGTESILATDKSISYKSKGQGEVTDYDMDNSESTVVISSGSGTQEAIITKRVYPEFLGALIVCEGGGSSAVRLMVTEAVSALTGLGSDKIKVTKMS